jgi:hypothetical protein
VALRRVVKCRASVVPDVIHGKYDIFACVPVQIARRHNAELWKCNPITIALHGFRASALVIASLKSATPSGHAISEAPWSTIYATNGERGVVDPGEGIPHR